MTGQRIGEVLYQLAEAFDGRGLEESNESQALLTNLATVSADEWRALPPGATRSIESMVLHVAGCKIMYADYAFGSGTKQWGTPEVEGLWQPGAAPMPAALDWLRDAHRSLIAEVERLSDDDLDRERPTNWGEMRPTRWILAAMVGHDFYHAGE